MSTYSKDWRCLAASVAGTSHIGRQLPCQDAYATAVFDNGFLIAAVADGAGSAKRSHEGARLSVQTSTTYVKQDIANHAPCTSKECEDLLIRSLHAARIALEQTTSVSELKELASTLLMVLITDQWLSTIQLGDGAIVSCDVHGDISVLSKANDSEYINETAFITSDDYWNRVQTLTIPSNEVNNVAMFSDGIQLLALNLSDNTAHEPFFRAMVEFARNPSATSSELEEFLLSERVCERTDDDKTLLLMVRDATLRPE